MAGRREAAIGGREPPLRAGPGRWVKGRRRGGGPGRHAEALLPLRGGGAAAAQDPRGAAGAEPRGAGRGAPRGDLR